MSRGHRDAASHAAKLDRATGETRRAQREAKLTALLERSQEHHSVTLEMVAEEYSDSQSGGLAECLEVLEQCWCGQRNGQLLALRVLGFQIRSKWVAEISDELAGIEPSGEGSSS